MYRWSQNIVPTLFGTHFCQTIQYYVFFCLNDFGFIYDSELFAPNICVLFILSTIISQFLFAYFKCIYKKKTNTKVCNITNLSFFLKQDSCYFVLNILSYRNNRTQAIFFCVRVGSSTQQAYFNFQYTCQSNIFQLTGQQSRQQSLLSS